MRHKNRALAFLLTLLMVLTFMPAMAFAEGADSSEEMRYIDLNSPFQVQVSSENSVSVYFNSNKTGGYLFKGISESSTNARVLIYESCPIDPGTDSNGWNRIQYEDFDGDFIYDEDSGTRIGRKVIIDYPFYAEAGKTYKIEIETSFDDAVCTYDLSLEESDRAGKLSNGLIYSSHTESDENGKEELLYDIVGYKGSETGTLKIPGELNGHRVQSIGDWAISGSFSSVSVGEGIESITNRAIMGDENLLTVELPSTLETIYHSPFSTADSRQAVRFPNGSDNFEVSDNMLIRKSEKALCFAFGPKQDTVNVPDGIREVKGDAFEYQAPKKIWIPKTVRSLFRMPGSLEEMHIGNANCVVSYNGIPRSDREDENYAYTVKVYAPAGGSLEQYCNENGIEFIAEGKPYDPSEIEPMGDPVKLKIGETAYGSFMTTNGDYQDFEFTAKEDGLYGFNIDFSGITGGIEIPDAYTYQLKDSDDNVINAVLEVPVREDGAPGFLLYLKKGKTYTLRLTATEEARNDEFRIDDIELFLFAAEPITVNGEGWNDYVASWDTQKMSKVFSFTAEKDGKYTITRKNTAEDDAGDLTMYLYAAESNGVTLVDQSRNTFSADLKGGKMYYLAVVLSGEEASASITVTDSNDGTSDPIKTGTKQTVEGNSFKVTSVKANTVSLVKAKKNAKSVTVPATVKLSDGEKYKVTKIEANAFKGTKATSVTLSKNIKTLKANAFNKSKVKTITVKSSKLTKSSVKKTLKGSKVTTIKVKIGSKKVNKKYVKKYKSIFTKKNAGRKVTVK